MSIFLNVHTYFNFKCYRTFVNDAALYNILIIIILSKQASLMLDPVNTTPNQSCFNSFFSRMIHLKKVVF